MPLAVTGANGLFGRALVSVIRNTGPVYGMTRQDADLTRIEEVRRALCALRPSAVIHAAAIADPDLCEEEPERAFETNVVATRNLVEVAQELGISVAYISTDAVFDGALERPLTETDPTHPISVYGKTKLLAESAVGAMDRSWIFRVSVLFGPGKENFVEKGLRLLRMGQTYTVAADQIGSATYTVDAAAKILEVMTSGHSGLFHLSNSGSCSRWELTRQAAIFAGLPVQSIIGKPLKEMARRGPRPKYAVMEMKALRDIGIVAPRPWKIALSEYLIASRAISHVSTGQQRKHLDEGSIPQ